MDQRALRIVAAVKPTWPIHAVEAQPKKGIHRRGTEYTEISFETLPLRVLSASAVNTPKAFRVLRAFVVNAVFSFLVAALPR